MSRPYSHGGNIAAVARAMNLPVTALIDFSASINPFGISLEVRTAIVTALDSLIHYPDSSHTELRTALARYHGLPPENFTIANGSTELIYNLPALLPGTKALLIAPCFSEYSQALLQHGWQVEQFILSPECNFSIDLLQLEKALSAGIDLLCLCNPANPSGTLYPQQVIEQIVALCGSSGTFLVLDEAFMDFCEEASAKQYIFRQEHAVILRSMTKFFGIPGLRLGYAISNSTLAERLDAMGGPWRVNTLALVAGTAALQDADYIRCTVAETSLERQILSRRLEQFACLRVYPSSVNYLLVEITGATSAAELQRQLLQQHILIRDCAGFTGLSERFFRVAVKNRIDNQRLTDGLEVVFRSWGECLYKE